MTLSRAKRLTAFVLLLLTFCLSACSSENGPQKPDDLAYRSDIVISSDYGVIRVGDTEYKPFYFSCDAEYLIPADAKVFGAVVEGESAADKSESDDFDIVYTSELCPDYVWLITSKDIENDEVYYLLSGRAEMYKAVRKNDSYQY